MDNIVGTEITNLESDWCNYTCNYKGRYTPMNNDLSVSIINMNIVSIETRLMMMENMFERMIKIVSESRNIERQVFDKIIEELK